MDAVIVPAGHPVRGRVVGRPAGGRAASRAGPPRRLLAALVNFM
jgi:hypothetical protein